MAAQEPGPLGRPEQADAVLVAELYEAWAAMGAGRDPVWAGRTIRQLAAELVELAPSTLSMIRAARRLHAEEAARAVQSGMGVVFGDCGYPAVPDPHIDLMTGEPLDGRMVYAAPSGPIAVVHRVRCAGVPGVSAVVADTADPESFVRVPEIADLIKAGPVQVQVQMMLQWLAPEVCNRMFAGFGRPGSDDGPLLPSGSEVLMTLATGTDNPLGRRFSEMLAPVGRLWAHDVRELSEWIESAGLELVGEAADVRARGLSWAADGFAAARQGQTVLAAIARVP